MTIRLTPSLRVVDRLLASPHYGERWGRYWLDVARYGEDQAHSFQPRLYPNGYRYRDWVVRALNRDFPYDRFVRRADRGRPDRRARSDRASGGPGLLRVRTGLLRRRPAARPVRRSDRHPDPRVPGADRRLRPLPRPQVRPDSDRPITMRSKASSPAPNTSKCPPCPRKSSTPIKSAQAAIQAKDKEITAS